MIYDGYYVLCYLHLSSLVPFWMDQFDRKAWQDKQRFRVKTIIQALFFASLLQVLIHTLFLQYVALAE